MAKIAFFTPSLNQASETFIRFQILHLKPEIIFFRGFDCQKYQDKNGRIRTVFRKRHVLLNKILPKKFKYKREKLIKEILERFNINLIIFQYSLTAINNFSWLQGCRIPYVIHFHGFDISVDSILMEFSRILKELIEGSAGIISVSKKMTERIYSISPKLNGSIFTQPCPPSFSLINETNHKSDKNSKLCVIINGRFVYKKAPIFHLFVIKGLVDLLSSNGEKSIIFEVRWIGGGELLEATRNLCKQLNLLGLIEFYGELPHKEAIQVVAQGDIYLQLSHVAIGGDREGTPVSLLEAGTLGLACLGTRHEGISDIIDDGINGFLVDEGDLQNAIIFLHKLITERETRLNFGINLKNKIVNDYNENVYLGGLMKLVNGITGKI